MFFFKNKLLLLKTETTYGTDASPTNLLNAVETEELSFEIVSQDVKRKIDAGIDGNMGSIPIGTHVKLDFKIALAGSGVAGTPPAFAAALLACRMTEVTTPGTSVIYSPSAAQGSSASGYFFLGDWRAKILGWRGTWKIDSSIGALPYLQFTGLGLWGGRTQQPLPVPTLTGYKMPVEISAANTAVSLHGVALGVYQFGFDLGLSPAFYEQTEQQVIISPERNATASLLFQAHSLATKDWAAAAQARTRDVLTITHGVTAGNIVGINAPKAQPGMPKWSDKDGMTAEGFNLDICPNTGNDEFGLSFT